VWESTEALLRADFESPNPRLLDATKAEAVALIDGLLDLGIVSEPGRIAVVGQSWGGLQALMLMAGDARVARAVGIMPICRATDLEPFASYVNTPGAINGSLTPTDAAVVAPRPLLLIGGEFDEIAKDSNIATFAAELEPYYRAAGAPEALEHVTLPDVGHSYDPRQIEHLRRWLDGAFWAR
jgi:pimeloyl-ACP methyl ester carboxylesterase